MKVVHPSEVLADYLKNMTVPNRMSVPDSFYNIVENKRNLTTIECQQLARWFRTSVDYWLNLQSQYDQQMELIDSKKLRVQMFEKWLHGEEIQYKLGGTQWHNMTEASLKFMKRSDIELREKPKLVQVDGQNLNKEDAIKFIERNY